MAEHRRRLQEQAAGWGMRSAATAGGDAFVECAKVVEELKP